MTELEYRYMNTVIQWEREGFTVVDIIIRSRSGNKAAYEIYYNSSTQRNRIILRHLHGATTVKLQCLEEPETQASIVPTSDHLAP